jgi:hypothetical protein
MTNGIKTIVTAIYELVYIEERNAPVYKSFPLMTETIRAQLFDNYNYIIYTDKKSYEKYDLIQYFNRPNIKIKFKELNQDLYVNNILPIKNECVKNGEIWERIYCVNNYLEVVLNKLEIMLIESTEQKEGQLIWLDAGLFGTSCHDGWRDYMRDIMVYGKELFLNKIFEKIDEFGFIATVGNQIQINYEVKDNLEKLSKKEIKLIPGCLFGGNVKKNIELMVNYKEYFLNYIKTYNKLISEQEVLSMILCDNNIKLFDFDEWGDLQKAFLKIMDAYDEVNYNTTKCYENTHNNQ